MWITYNGSRCVLALDRVVGEGVMWNGVPKDECEKFPNHYSIRDGGRCFYCKGTFNSTTGVCDTNTCENYPEAINLYGSDEAICARCGGSFSIVNTSWGRVTLCYIQK